MKIKRILSPIVLSLAFATAAYGWSGTEHRLMAYIAQEHLLPQTQAVLDRYLDQSIVEYASWMDRYRNSKGYEMTTHWHMVSIAQDGLSLVERDKSRGLAAYALHDAVEILKNYKEYSDSTVYINIMYIVHLVPEVHCPSHYHFYEFGGAKGAIDRCFQNVWLKGKKEGYHHIWDSSISTINPGLTRDQYKELFDTWTPEQQKAVSDGTVEDWILSNAAKVKVIYDWANPGERLDDDFMLQHRSLPESMVAPAGYRLARLLNDLFGGEQQ